VGSYTKNFENKNQYLDWNLKVLGNIVEMVSQNDILNVRPDENARKTINVCL